MGQVDVVDALDELSEVLDAGGVLSDQVAQKGDAHGLVYGDPHVNKVPELLKEDLGKVGKVIGGLSCCPSALCLDLAGHVPVVDCAAGLHPVPVKLLTEVSVIGDSLWVDLLSAVGKDPGPGD